MPNSIDQAAANIAMRTAIARWRKYPDDSIAASLDGPAEWVQEASLMNQYLPPWMQKAGYSFLAVQPVEFQVGIKLVRNYAGLVYRHMVALHPAASDPNLQLDLFDHDQTKGIADQHAALHPDEVTGLTAEMFGYAPNGG